MKKLLLLFALIFSLGVSAQALEGGHKYKATIQTTGGSNVNYEFTTRDYGEDLIVDIPEFGDDFPKKKTQNHKNQTTMTFIQSGGVWTESQTFIFTKDPYDGKIYVYLMRVVQNNGDDPWEVIGIGEVTKVW